MSRLAVNEPTRAQKPSVRGFTKAPEPSPENNATKALGVLQEIADAAGGDQPLERTISARRVGAIV